MTGPKPCHWLLSVWHMWRVCASRVVLMAGLMMVALALSAQAIEEMKVTAANVIAYGKFESKNDRKLSDATSDAPRADAITGAYFTDITKDIDAKLGDSFGLRFILHGPRSRTAHLKAVIHFPEGGLVSPRGRVYETSTEYFDVPHGKEAMYGYGFDEPWELVPGEWTFEIWNYGHKIIERQFNVTVNQAAESDSP